jgi:hypothetical protein
MAEYIYPKKFYQKIYNKKTLSGFYFKKITHVIVNILKQNFSEKKIVLDFGCGEGYLKKIVNQKKINHKVYNYDTIEELSEIKDWENINFDVFVAIHVFCLFNINELEQLINKIKKINPNVEIIVGMERPRNAIFKLIINIIKSFTNKEKIGTFFNKTTPEEELRILLKYCKIIDKRNIFFMTNVIRLKFL